MERNHHPKPLITNMALARELLERLVRPAIMVMSIFVFGTVGFYLVGRGMWDLFDCAYMTSITLTTVGYGEVLEQIGTGGRLFAMALMWSGMGVTLYAISAITGFVVDKNLGRIFRERKMEKRIAALKNHYIVCGGGKTAFNVARELTTSRQPTVMIETNADRLEWVGKQLATLHFIQGDATEEEVLRRAGIERASGILAVLGEDSHNLLITVQARYVNPSIKIVARCQENNLADKFYRAGANYVVNPAFIGGMRMVSEMVRPHVVSFLDRMLRGKDKSVRVEEVEVCESSPWAGCSLAEIEMHSKTGLIPISLKQPGDSDYNYNPSPKEVLKPGTILIVIGNPEQVSRLKSFCAKKDDEGELDFPMDT